MNTQLTALRGENSRLGSVGETAAALRAEVAAAKAKLADAVKAAEVHGTSVAELTGQNEKIAAEKITVQQQLEQARTAAEQMRGDLAELRGRVTAGSRALEQQVGTLNDAAAAGEKLQAQVRDLNVQLVALRTENSRLATVGDSAATLRTELADLQGKLADAAKAAVQQSAAVAELTGTNEKVGAEMKDVQAQLSTLRTENARLAQLGEQARQEAEQRAAGLSSTAAAQAATTQRDLAALRTENARLTDSLQALERDRVTRVSQLQQDNAAISARLRQAQSTLDQIASAARLINGGVGPAASPLPSATPTISSQPSPATPSPARAHIVQEGDSLTRISSRYYGTSGRWQEIYDANREVLKGENALRLGQKLVIP